METFLSLYEVKVSVSIIIFSKNYITKQKLCDLYLHINIDYDFLTKNF